MSIDASTRARFVAFFGRAFAARAGLVDAAPERSATEAPEPRRRRVRTKAWADVVAAARIVDVGRGLVLGLVAAGADCTRDVVLFRQGEAPRLVPLAELVARLEGYSPGAGREVRAMLGDGWIVTVKLTREDWRSAAVARLRLAPTRTTGT